MRLAGLLAAVALVPFFLVAWVWPNFATMTWLVSLPGQVTLVASVVWPNVLDRLGAPAPQQEASLPTLFSRLQDKLQKYRRRRKVARWWAFGALVLAVGTTVVLAEWERLYSCPELQLIVPDGYRGELRLVEGDADGVDLRGERPVVHVPPLGVVMIRGKLVVTGLVLSGRPRAAHPGEAHGRICEVTVGATRSTVRTRRRAGRRAP
jgi:hypothetical protein